MPRARFTLPLQDLLVLASLILASALTIPCAVAEIAPAKSWFAPNQPLTFTNLGERAVELVLVDFLGRRIQSEASAVVAPGAAMDVHAVYPAMGVGTYLLYPVEPDGATVNFVATPYVIGVRGDSRPGAPADAVVVKVEPLRYATIQTPSGEMTVAFYYDAAPNTVANFLSLAEGGFYDGLSFHRIVPGFVLQGGDPRDDTTGGPGYMIDAEFNDKPHLPGVLSMARQGDPIERQGAMPRGEAANSAGSQFFIALDHARTARLDGRYTAFGRVVEGMDEVQRMGEVEIANPATGQPRERQPIVRIRVRMVAPGEPNPYLKLLDVNEAELDASRGPAATLPTTAPTTAPATRAGGGV